MALAQTLHAGQLSTARVHRARQWGSGRVAHGVLIPPVASRLVSCPLATPSPLEALSSRRHLLQLLTSGTVLTHGQVLCPVATAAAQLDTQQTSTADSTEQWRTPVDPPTYVTATGRIVAIGDLHGDLDKAVEALRLAGVLKIGDQGEVAWVGGDTVVVQLGDVMDRGDVEIGILNLLRFLDGEARKEGGAVYMLNGNHETLNVCGDFRYVTPGAFAESAMYAGMPEKDFKDWQMVARVRYQLYKPGGELAKELSKNPTVLVVNDTVFAHGGLLPTHVEYGLERMNAEVAAWMRGDDAPDGSGKTQAPQIAMGDANSVMWNRTLSKERFPTPYERYHACRQLTQALNRCKGKRLVVGHTPQLMGANCECDNMVWRIDVGMSYGVLNRPVQVLEIDKGADGETQVRILRTPGAPTGNGLDDDIASQV